MKLIGKILLVVLFLVSFDLFMRRDSIIIKISHAVESRYLTRDYMSYFKEAEAKMYSDPKNAIELIDRSIQLNGRSYAAYELKFRIHKEMKDKEGMIRTFHRMTEIEPSDFNYFLEVGQMFSQDGQLVEAMQVYTRYINLNKIDDENMSLAYYWRSYLKYQLGDNNSALEDINFSILHTDKKGDFLKGSFFLRALIKFDKKDYHGAIQDFETSLNQIFLDKNYIYYGVALQNIGETERACKVWRNLAEEWGYPEAYNYIRKYCN